LNFVSNSLKFSNNGGKVTVKLSIKNLTLAKDEMVNHEADIYNNLSESSDKEEDEYTVKV